MTSLRTTETVTGSNWLLPCRWQEPADPMCVHWGWRGGAARPLRTPGSARTCRAGGVAPADVRPSRCARPTDHRAVRAAGRVSSGGLDGPPRSTSADERGRGGPDSCFLATVARSVRWPARSPCVDTLKITMYLGLPGDRGQAKTLDMARQQLKWTDPNGVDLSKPYLYFFSTVDPDTATEYRYVGKSSGKGVRGRRLKESVSNVKKIFRGQPRGEEQQYRAVHLAMAKACEFNWGYKFFPLKNTRLDDLDWSEKEEIQKLSCNLNCRPTWPVKEYSRLRMTDLVPEPAQPGPRPAPR